MKDLKIKFCASLIFWACANGVLAGSDEHLHVKMLDIEGESIIEFTEDEFGVNKILPNDQHIGYSYRLCSGANGVLCAIHLGGIAFPYVVVKEKLSLGQTWEFDGDSFRVIADYHNAPNRFSTCQSVKWIEAVKPNYSHKFAYSETCGVIGGCFDWRNEEELCYWSSETQGFSLNSDIYTEQSIFTHKQERALRLGHLRAHDRESFKLRNQCLDDDQYCPE